MVITCEIRREIRREITNTNEDISLKGKERRIEGDISVIRRSVLHIYLQLRIVFLRQDGIPKTNVTSLEWQGKNKLPQLPLVL